MTTPKKHDLFTICIITACLILMILPATAQTIVPPFVITSPGTYEITSDLQSIKDQTAITIESSDVTINGNGCYIGGIGREKSIGILVNKRGDYLTNITISRVKLHDWGTALALRYVQGEKGDINVINKNVILNSATGIEIDACDYLTLSSNEISDCATGIKIGGNSNNIDLSKNTVDKNGYGIDILDTNHVLLRENHATNSEIYGIQIVDSTDANLTRNSASDNQYSGIRLGNVNDFQIVSNDISGSVKGGGIELGTGVSNGIVYDNYLRNRQNVEVKTVSENILWNVEKQPGINIVAGPYFAGNFWGADDEEEGFSQYTPDTEGWGICDEPYQINTIHTDYLPLHYTDKRVAPEVSQESQPATEELTNTTTTESATVINTTDTGTAPVQQEETETTPASPAFGSAEQAGEEQEIVPEDITDPFQQQDLVNNTSQSQESEYQTVAVTNSYKDGEATSETGTDTSTGEDEETNEIVTISSAPQTTPPQVTYGKYSIHGPEDAAVFFVTDSDVKVFIGRITDGKLDFTVPLDGIRFVSYAIEREDIDPITGDITELPKENETIVIDVSEGETGSENPVNSSQQADNKIGAKSFFVTIDGEIPESSKETENAIENDYHEIVVTNAYGDDSHTSDTPPDDEELTANTTAPEATPDATPKPNTTFQQYTVGYYSIHGPDDAAVFFVTDAGVKVFMGRVINGTLDFPVPVNGISYTSYIIEGDGFDSVTGGIYEFPNTGDTVVIDVSDQIGSKGETVSNETVRETEVIGLHVDEEPVETVTIVVTPDDGGMIVPGGEIEVRKGEGITFTITPDDGYITEYLLFDGVKIGAESTFTLEELDSDHTFSASFEQVP